MQGSCYNFSSGTLNWNQAKSACEKLGSNLVAINSQAEQQALASKITYNQWTWIGFYRNPEDKSQWLWVDGSRSTYTNWNTGEPNSHGEECAHMYSEASEANRFKWNDQKCIDTFRYICEINGRSENIAPLHFTILKLTVNLHRSFTKIILNEVQVFCCCVKVPGPPRSFV